MKPGPRIGWTALATFLIVAAVITPAAASPRVRDCPADTPVSPPCANAVPPLVGSPAAQEKGANIVLHFDQDKLTPQPPAGNGSQSKQVAGKAVGARVAGTIIGTWSQAFTGSFSVDGDLGIELWAQSQQGAKNAGFRVNVYQADGNLVAFFTNRQDLGPTPVKFTASGPFSSTYEAGTKLDVQLVWLSDPQFFVGPSAGGEFVYGSTAVDSRVTVAATTHPIVIQNVTVPKEQISRQTLVVKVDFADALGADPASLIYKLTVTGPTAASPDHLKGPVTAAAGNVSSVSWQWMHALEKGGSSMSGMYTIGTIISYDGNSTVTNSTAIQIDLPHGPMTGGTNPFTDKTIGLYLTIGVVAGSLVVVAAVVLYLLRKRKFSLPFRKPVVAAAAAPTTEGALPYGSSPSPTSRPTK